MTPFRLLPLALTALLASCMDKAPPADDYAAAPSRGVLATSGQPAKELFGHVASASAQAPAVWGFYSKGCVAGAVQLPETGPTWQAMRLSRGRNWGHPELVDFIQDLSRKAAALPGWNGLYVGDMSQPRGGPMLSGHASHQVGLDVDIWMLPPTRLDLTRDERENLSSIRIDRQTGAYTGENWTAQHMAVMKAAAQDPRVERVFVVAGAKVAMCDAETGDRSWLGKIRPLAAHNYHFHVRLACPSGSPGCVDQAPPPSGDGCDDAREAVRLILNPPPPNPNPPPATPPRGPLTMADLPSQCSAVLQSQ